jgi:nucleoside-diphosphate-sugar epimerase
MKILITGGNGNIATMIKKNFITDYDITALSRDSLNLLNFNQIKEYLEINSFDILIHTAISGGRRTKTENGDIVHNNLLMLENLLFFANKFKMILNFDSGAIYDRKTDILNRKENELLSVTSDYYGFSKYLIYQRSLLYSNMYNLRIFNIFHDNEEPDRFIKACKNAEKTNKELIINEDKYFDFMHELDFMKIIKYYLDNVDNQNKLEKTVNVCYEKKYKLSEIANLIISNKNNIKIILNSDKNYTGNNELLQKYNIEFMTLEDRLLANL